MISVDRSAEQSIPRARVYQLFAALVLLSLVVSVCFLPSLKVGLLGDDFTYFNWLRVSPADLLAQGLSDRYLFLPFSCQLYRPASVAFILVDLLVCGNNSFALHFSNILWHLGASILCFLTVLKLLESFKVLNHFQIAFWTSIIFAIHPFHAEAIDWWASKSDIMFSCFYLLAFLLFMIGRTSGQLACRIGAPLAFLVSISCKESALSFPFFILSYLFCLEEKSTLLNRIRFAFKSSAVFFISLIAYWTLRWLVLGTPAGIYYGLIHGFWFARLQDNFGDIFRFSTLFFPIDVGSGFLVLYGAPVIALIHAYALIDYARARMRQQVPDINRFLLFVLLIFIVCTLPACSIWYPRANLENTRVLYMAVLPLSLLLPCLFLARSSVKRFAYFLLFCYCIVLACSSYQFQIRWTRATQAVSGFGTALVQKISEQGKTGRLLLLDVPSHFDDVPLRLYFPFILDMLRPPFVQNLNLNVLGALGPFGFDDRKNLNLSLLRRALAADTAGSLKLLYWLKNTDGFTLLELDKNAVKQVSDSPDLELSVQDQGIVQNRRFSYLRIPHTRKAKDYQFLKLKFDKPLHLGEKPDSLVALWKRDDEKTLTVKDSCCLFAASGKNSESEKMLHLGESIDWIFSKDVDAIQIMSEGDSTLQSAVLVSDKNLVPELMAIPGRSEKSSDSILSGKDGKVYFSFDASNIENACSVRVEISEPCCRFNDYVGTYRDNQFCPWAMKSFDIPKSKGSFAISCFLGTPAWNQVRILAKSSDGKVLGFSSDPLQMRSSPGPVPEHYYELFDQAGDSNTKTTGG